MAERYDLHNLELNDNQFETVPAGSYHFRVANTEEGAYGGKSDKIPNGTQQIIVSMDIPYTTEAGGYKIAPVRLTLNVYAKGIFAVRQFAESIGLCKETGKFKFDMDDAIGKDGICEIELSTSDKGNEFSRVKQCYPPSKAPKRCVNDKEWDNYAKGLTPVETEGDPF